MDDAGWKEGEGAGLEHRSREERSGMKKAKKRKKAKFRLPRLGSLVVGGVLTAFAGFIGLVIVYGAMNSGGGRDEFAPDIVETASESHGGEPFEGGPRLHFPVVSIDMGQVPLGTRVNYAFEMTNVGDVAAHIEDVDVSVLEGC